MSDGLFYNDELSERFVVCFESIAKSLEGLNESAKRAGTRYWPEFKQPREAVISRIPNEEDKIKEAQGASDKPITEWLGELGEPEDDTEYLGERTKQWIKDHPSESNASPKVDSISGPEGTSTEEAEDKA